MIAQIIKYGLKRYYSHPLKNDQLLPFGTIQPLIKSHT
jgi:hypothetical protein